MKPSALKFPILYTLNNHLDSLSNHSIKMNLDRKTICLKRSLIDNYSKQSTNMVSAVCNTIIKNKLYYIIISEQKNKNNEVIKYSIQLTNKNKLCIKYYDKDVKIGIHTHYCKNNKKIRKHIPFKGGLKKIAEDIIKTTKN